MKFQSLFTLPSRPGYSLSLRLLIAIALVLASLPLSVLAPPPLAPPSALAATRTLNQPAVCPFGSNWSGTFCWQDGI